MLMAQARNIYAGNDINRVFRVVYYHGAFVLHFLPLKCAAVEGRKKKIETANFSGALPAHFSAGKFMSG